jgi:hypothetical protein
VIVDVKKRYGKGLRTAPAKRRQKVLEGESRGETSFKRFPLWPPEASDIRHPAFFLPALSG